MNKRFVYMIALAVTLFASVAYPQQDSGGQQQIQRMREAMVANVQKLHGYQWIETTTVTVDGNTRAPRESLCRYRADGTVQRTPLAQSQENGAGMPLGRGGLIRGIMARKKKEKYQKDFEEIRTLGRLYIPIVPARLRAALQAGEVTFAPEGADETTVIINSYAKQGDRLKIVFNRSTMQPETVSIRTWLDKPKDVVTENVTFATLGDGTRYPAMISVNAPSKKLSATTTNSDYSRTAD